MGTLTNLKAEDLIWSLKDNVTGKQEIINSLNSEIMQCRELLRRAMVVIQVDLPRSDDTRKITHDIRDYLEIR